MSHARVKAVPLRHGDDGPVRTAQLLWRAFFLSFLQKTGKASFYPIFVTKSMILERLSLRTSRKIWTWLIERGLQEHNKFRLEAPSYSRDTPRFAMQLL